eukprot:COSAG05_NODE_71_length_22071_cov_17.527149_5_plen_53_part_00
MAATATFVWEHVCLYITYHPPYSALMRIAHSHDVLDSSLHTPDSHGLLTAYD